MTNVDDESRRSEPHSMPRQGKSNEFAGTLLMEPTGIEPVTSCLQRSLGKALQEARKQQKSAKRVP